MSFCGSRRLFVAGIAIALVLLSAGKALAQQVTYYDFDAPQSSGQSSYKCVNPTPNSPAVVSNPLFCFNDATGAASNPSFLSGPYPAIIDPVTTDNPPVDSTHYGVQMTPPVGGQAGSMWFSVPQKVSSGFTAYFAFRLTPNPSSYATADGLAFVIQNSAGGGSASGCAASGSGVAIVGGGGGCIGYGGIDNSLALEFDTYQNGWDPVDIPNSINDNHVALQNCGAGLPNSPDHTGSCLVNLNVAGVVKAAITSSFGVTLADGNVHQVVVEYSGPTEATPNQIQVFIDPAFVSGTHTPVPESVPALTGTYDIAANLNLMNSGTDNDSAYVGFTAATGAAFEKHELLAWTFTPHTPSTQQQPLNPPGTPTVFPFGSHTFAVTFPVGTTTANIDMSVTANTITPAFFTQLSVGRPYAGSQCQVYDETGGNCVVYSVTCLTHGTTTVVDCPPAADPSNLIALKTSYNNTVQPTNPGFLQGDPLYTVISSVTGDGTTATVLCGGECSVTAGQTVTIGGTTTGGASPASFDGDVIVVTANPDNFTFASTVSGTSTTGYIASNNVENIFTSYSPQRIDGTTAGKTKNFSSFIATSTTVATTTNLSVSAPTISYGGTASVTVTATSLAGTPTGDVSLSVDNGAPQTQPLSNGTATFTLTGLSGGPHQLTVTYAGQTNFPASTATSSLTITPIAPSVTFTGAPSTAVFGSAFTVAATTVASTTPTITASGACTIAGLTVTMTSGTGVCSLSASWPADSNYTAATASQSTLAAKAASNVAITADTPNPSTTGSPVTVGFTVTGTGTPTGSYTISSSLSGDPAFTGTVNAGAGGTMLTFATPGPRTITVAYSGDSNFLAASASFVQTVNSGAIASVSPGSLDFGIVYLGSASTKTVTVTNTGGAALTITDKFIQIVAGGNSNEFAAVNLCPASLAPGRSCSIIVGFVAGPYYTPQTAVLMITDNAPGSPQKVSLTATVINPVASFRPSEIEFSAQKVGSISKGSTVLTNTGATPLNISKVAVTGPYASDYVATSLCPPSLAPGASCSISVVFKPSGTGSRSANLTVTDNARNGTQQIELDGRGK